MHGSPSSALPKRLGDLIPRGGRASAALVALGLCLVGFACGEDEREFTASELISELADRGAPLDLEGTLHNDQEGVVVYELSLSDPRSGAHSEESGASLILAESEEIAISEFERCDSAVRLVCFRVANGVVYLSNHDPGPIGEIETAVKDMESD